MNDKPFSAEYKGGHPQEDIYAAMMENRKGGKPTESISDAIAEAKAMGLRADQAAMAQMERLKAARDQELETLRKALDQFILEEGHLVKGFMANESKKQLAREVIHLRGVVKTVQQTVKAIGQGAAPAFQHREAFAMMVYAKVNGGPTDVPSTIRVWNSRDGVTPFFVNLGEARYQHEIGLMYGPFYDLPVNEQPTHKWVTRTDWEVMVAWRATVAAAVAKGLMTQEKADTVVGRMDVAEGWNYRLGLVNLATGNYTDAEVLKTAPATGVAPTEVTAGQQLIGD